MTPANAVQFERIGNVGVIVIDRPPVNAYDAELERDLAQAWHQAAEDVSVRVVLLRASGPHFCAGADTKSPDSELAQSEMPGEFFSFCRNLPKPTIAAVQGAVSAGGQRFVWPCDLIVASPDAFFADPTVALGIGGIPCHGHTWEYGPRLAKEMLFTGGRLSASRLYEMGAINRIVPADRLKSEAMSLAEQIAKQPAPALREAKRAVNVTMDVMGMHYIIGRFNELSDADLHRGLSVNPDDDENELGS